MIIPPYIGDNGPSWDEGMANDILPYLIDVTVYGYFIIHPSGKKVLCREDHFRQYLRMAVNGIITARIAYDGDLTPCLTTGDIQSKPTGQVGDWFMTERGGIAQYQGEMFSYDLRTGAKRKEPVYARKKGWVFNEALHPVAGNVLHDYTQQDIFIASVISARKEILSVTLMKNGQPFTGRLAGWADDGFFITTWVNGLFLEFIKANGNTFEYYSADFIVTVETTTQTLAEEIRMSEIDP